MARKMTKRLIEWADIVTDGFTPGSMKALGLDYEEARKIKPGIIYYSICQMGFWDSVSHFTASGRMEIPGWSSQACDNVSNAGKNIKERK
jgi:hypothetical protein